MQGHRNNVTHMPPPRCPVIIKDHFEVEGKRRCNRPSQEHSDNGMCQECDIVAKQEREKITTHAIDVRIYIKSHNAVVTDEDVKAELLHQIFVGAHEDIKLDWIEIEKNSVQLVAEGE